WYIIDSPVPPAQDTGGGRPALPAQHHGPVVPSPSGTTGNLLATIDALGDETAYTYNATGNGRGQLATVVDSRNDPTQYTAYDRYGNPTTIIDPVGNQTAQTFDARSRLMTKEVSFGGQNKLLVVNAYDKLDRVLDERKVDELDHLAAQTMHYEYMPHG